MDLTRATTDVRRASYHPVFCKSERLKIKAEQPGRDSYHIAIMLATLCDARELTKRGGTRRRVMQGNSRNEESHVACCKVTRGCTSCDCKVTCLVSRDTRWCMWRMTVGCTMSTHVHDGDLLPFRDLSLFLSQLALDS
jgi:hypothetical protein